MGEQWRVTACPPAFPAEVVRKVNELIATGQYGRLFAVVHFASHQWKVTSEDLILIGNDLDLQCGERIRLEKVRPPSFSGHSGARGSATKYAIPTPQLTLTRVPQSQVEANKAEAQKGLWGMPKAGLGSKGRVGLRCSEGGAWPSRPPHGCALVGSQPQVLNVEIGSWQMKLMSQRGQSFSFCIALTSLSVISDYVTHCNELLIKQKILFE
ncbi:hypothetical protein P7K49_021337 [Saguinus oedipus]|uniref:Large ribosomal subunit protein bL21m n=1 Tax=Saguinus oedipus TaxID=9490 RepID=A0ABQ9USD9_SAGOE|nr:hypothetical protein P7K49_021337 [Saguinus oedipus]